MTTTATEGCSRAPPPPSLPSLPAELWWHVLRSRLEVEFWPVAASVCRGWRAVLSAEAGPNDAARRPVLGCLFRTVELYRTVSSVSWLGCGLCWGREGHSHRREPWRTVSLSLLVHAVHRDAVRLVAWLCAHARTAATVHSGDEATTTTTGTDREGPPAFLHRTLAALAAHYGAQRVLEWCLADRSGSGWLASIESGAARGIVRAAALSRSIDVVYAVCRALATVARLGRGPETETEVRRRFLHKAAKAALSNGAIETARALCDRWSLCPEARGIALYLQDADRPYDAAGVEWLAAIGCRSTAADFAAAVERGATVAELGRLRALGWPWDARATLAAAAAGRGDVLGWLTIGCDPPCPWHPHTVRAAANAVDGLAAAAWIWEHGCFCWRGDPRRDPRAPGRAPFANDLNPKTPIPPEQVEMETRDGEGEGDGAGELDALLARPCDCWEHLAPSLLASGHLVPL